MRRHLGMMFLLIGLLSMAGAAQDPSTRNAAEAATKAIRPEQIRAHIRFLADSLLQGREPGAPGYDVAARYVATQLEGMGLHPGVSGGWYQPVPLLKSVTDEGASSLVLTINGQELVLANEKDFAVYPAFAAPAKDGSRAESDINAPLVFVGFGVTAPEQKYDDYAGVDVRGKIAVLIGGAPSRLPSTVRAYYSDAIVKEKNALAHGAVGIFEVWLPEDWKRDPWDWWMPQMRSGMLWLDRAGVPHNYFPTLRSSAVLGEQAAPKLFVGAPKTIDEIFAAARAGKSQAFPLAVSAHLHHAAVQRVVHSSNVIAELEGADPRLRGQYVVFTSHIDHLGICPAVDGDNVCHGALDNASGVATLLEIARVYSRLSPPPRRSILFAFVTGEEMGLLGSDYFVHYPTIPVESIVANVNMDCAPGEYYSMKDVIPLGAEHSTLYEEVSAAGKMLGYELTPDPMPEENNFIRSDQYSFVLQGIPAVDVTDGIHATDTKIDGLAYQKKWLVTRYHTPLDNIDQPIDFDSMAKGAVMNFVIGYQVAQRDRIPEWNKGDFFGMTFGAKRTGGAGE